MRIGKDTESGLGYYDKCIHAVIFCQSICLHVCTLQRSAILRPEILGQCGFWMSYTQVAICCSFPCTTEYRCTIYNIQQKYTKNLKRLDWRTSEDFSIYRFLSSLYLIYLYCIVPLPLQCISPISRAFSLSSPSPLSILPRVFFCWNSQHLRPDYNQPWLQITRRVKVNMTKSSEKLDLVLKDDQ